MKVTRLRLLNFRGVETLDVSFLHRTTAFVGVNGVGKSTVLDALAISLSQLIWRINGTAQRARPIALDDIRQGADFARIELDVVVGAQALKWAIATNRSKGPYSDPLRKSELSNLNEWVKTNVGPLPELHASHLPLAVHYDVNRAVVQVPMRVREKPQHDAREVYQGALEHGGADFKRFFSWFRNLEDAENEARTEKPAFRDRGLEAARQAISSFTQFSGIRIRRKPTMRMTVVKDGKEFNVLQLSDGERNMLALVGDLAYRLSILNPGLANPNLGEGVVLIDELDLHLHPRWQREAVAKLESTFPNCQFVISTHSPQIIGELPAEAVMLLRQGHLLGHASRALGLSSGEVLEELMEGSARNAEFSAQALSVERAMEQQRYLEAKQGLEALRRTYGDLPEVLRLEEMLQWEFPQPGPAEEYEGHGR